MVTMGKTLALMVIALLSLMAVVGFGLFVFLFVQSVASHNATATNDLAGARSLIIGGGVWLVSVVTAFFATPPGKVVEQTLSSDVARVANTEFKAGYLPVTVEASQVERKLDAVLNGLSKLNMDRATVSDVAAPVHAVSPIAAQP